ncbi:uncharacterized protein [Panulirus ornatus]|uniref:uncharacterized protein n=1 Tax=Panulirus ornatus TaxID=150431 RepID=UPI003A8A67FE
MLMTFHLTVTLLAGLAASGQARSLKVGYPLQTAGIFDPWDYDYTYGDPTFHYDGVPERETTAKEVDHPVIRMDPEPQEVDQGRRQGVYTLNDPYDYSYTYGDYMMDYEVVPPARPTGTSRDDPQPPGGAIPEVDDHFIGSSPPHDNRDHSPSQPEGVDEEGVEEEGVGQEGVDEEGVDEEGVGQEGVDEEGVGQEGVDEEGVDEEGVEEEGVDEEGVDEEGVDEEGVEEYSSISRLLQWLQDQLRNVSVTSSGGCQKVVLPVVGVRKWYKLGVTSSGGCQKVVLPVVGVRKWYKLGVTSSVVVSESGTSPCFGTPVPVPHVIMELSPSTPMLSWYPGLFQTIV